LFVENNLSNKNELKSILTSNLKEYILVKNKL